MLEGGTHWYCHWMDGYAIITIHAIKYTRGFSAFSVYLTNSSWIYEAD